MNNERIKNWAHFAEIISGIAVVISLVFLIVEIRGNSDLIRANTFNRSIESLIDFRMQIASNDASLQVMTDHWGIDSPEALRRQLLVVNMWSIYEKTYYSQRYGLVGPAEWERFETRICGYTVDGLAFWRDNVARFLSEEFRNHVISTCHLEPV
jgi:hypothetical protein